MMNKSIALILSSTLACTVAAAAQTTPAPKPATPKPAVTAKPTTGTRTTTGAIGPKLPPGVTPVRGILHTAFALRYQEVKIGTGPLAEPGKLYKVKYTGWLAADGKKFDSSDDHPGGQPIQFPQGHGRVIPGWDQGFEGMKIGGKRRLFIPYQLAYGAMGRAPVIPAKSDLIFDVELVAVDELPNMPPAVPGGMRQMPSGPRTPPTPPSGQPGAPAKPAAPSTPPPATTPDKPTNPAQPN